MSYLQIVSTVFWALFLFLTLIVAHFLFFAAVGLFAKKRFPHTDVRYKYGIIIPARNEEAVVSGLIESVQKNNYPQDKLHIFVIAHNCTDRTAEIARSMGATVYEYNNPKENTMGYAFRYLFSCIERDYGTQNYDGFFLFNADNILDRNYFAAMNDAFAYYDKKYVITSFRNSKNFGANLISGLYGLYFATGCRLESRGRTVLGCSTRVQGTGYVINSSIVKDGWPYVSLTEDWEFSADQILQSNKIRYCDDAVFYDEQPTTFSIMWRQRVRWSRGHLLVFYARFRDLIASIFRPKQPHKGSLLDISVNMLPYTLLWFVVFVLQFVALLLVPVVDPSVTFREVFLGNGNFFTSTGALFSTLRMTALAYLCSVFSAALVFIAEHRRIKGVSFFKKCAVCLVWPIFMGLQLPIDLQAFFSRNLGWKPIPHKDQTSFAHVNEHVEIPEKAASADAADGE